MKRQQSIEQVRWDLALRYRLIEIGDWREVRLTTNHGNVAPTASDPGAIRIFQLVDLHSGD